MKTRVWQMEDNKQFDDCERRTHVRTIIDQARRQADVCTTSLRRSLLPSAGSAPDFGSDYEVTGEVHRGGQGIVYRAKQRSTGRTVAIKLMREGPFSTTRDRIRFEREVHILGQLNHPNIVGILNSGTAGGAAFFVMDFVSGESLSTWTVDTDDQSSDWETASGRILQLFIKICDAVHAAHLHGVIHRDLKPSNILVDSSGEPHILDFGVAKLEADDHTTDITMTSPGHFIGSLPWASPEQASGATHEIDIRSDVYSLGAILYQLLTGKHPHSVCDNVRDVLDRIMTAEPVRPRDVRRDFDDELETIVLKCMAKEAARRYQSAGELARDLRHYLADEPIEAKRDSTWYVLGKTLRRHRGRFAAAIAFFLLVTSASVLVSILYAKQGLLLTEVKRQRDRSATAEMLADVRFQQAKYESYVANIAAAAAAIAANDGGTALKRLQTAPLELRNWEWHYLRNQADESVATWHGPQGFITGRVRLSHDGKYVGASYWMEGQNGVLRVWPRTAETTYSELTCSMRHAPFEFLAEERELLYCDHPGFTSRRDSSTLSELNRHEFGDGGFSNVTEISSDTRFVLLSDSQRYGIWDTVDNRLLGRFTLAGCVCSAVEPGGRHLALGQANGSLSVHDLSSGHELVRVNAHNGVVYGVAFSPDGRQLATSGSENGELKLWELVEAKKSLADVPSDSATTISLQLIREFRDGVQRVGLISFSPDGKFIAAPSEDKAVRLWDIRGSEPVRRLLGHTTGVVSVGFSNDGRWLVTGAREGVVKLWDLHRQSAANVLGGLPAPVNSIVFYPDGKRVLTNCEGRVCLIDMASRLRLFEYPDSVAKPQGILTGPGDAKFTSGTKEGHIRIRELGDDRETLVLNAHSSAPILATNRASNVMASADPDSIILWDWTLAREIRRFSGPQQDLRCLDIAHDATRLALALQDGELLIMDTENGSTRILASKSNHHFASAMFSPDGRFLATASSDQSVKLWNTESGQVVWSASLDFGDIWCVAFSPDGTRLAAGGRDRSVRLFDVSNGQELLALRGLTGTVMSLSFSPDGQTIAAGSWSREVAIWKTLVAEEN